MFKACAQLCAAFYECFNLRCTTCPGPNTTEAKCGEHKSQMICSWVGGGQNKAKRKGEYWARARCPETGFPLLLCLCTFCAKLEFVVFRVVRCLTWYVIKQQLSFLNPQRHCAMSAQKAKPTPGETSPRKWTTQSIARDAAQKCWAGTIILRDKRQIIPFLYERNKRHYLMSDIKSVWEERHAEALAGHLHYKYLTQMWNWRLATIFFFAGPYNTFYTVCQAFPSEPSVAESISDALKSQATQHRHILRSAEHKYKGSCESHNHMLRLIWQISHFMLHNLK